MKPEIIKVGHNLKTLGYKDDKGNTFRLIDGHFFPMPKEDYKPIKQ